MKNSSAAWRRDFLIGVPMARGVFIGFCNILMNIPLFPPFFRRRHPLGKGGLPLTNSLIELSFEWGKINLALR